MKLEIDVDTEFFDSMVKRDLERFALHMLDEKYADKYELPHKKAEVFSALCRVIEYYSTPEEYQEFLEKTKGKKIH